MNHARRDDEWLRANRSGYEYVNKPDHYAKGRKYEPIDVIEDWDLDFHLGNAVKYIGRAGRKPGEDKLKELCKAIYYLERVVDNVLDEEDREAIEQAQDADELLAAKGRHFSDIPRSVLPGSDETEWSELDYDEIINFAFEDDKDPWDELPSDSEVSEFDR